jgi:hypothetical protein
MNNVRDLKVMRYGEPESCASCFYSQFIIIHDRQVGYIVVCDGCSSVIGELKTITENSTDD